MKNRRLWKIIRTTKVLEELAGLLVIMLIFALFLTKIEPGIERYDDGLWYTFAVVTTIGFGDFTAVTIVGRILTIILGLFGILNIAIITSVVVNYYQVNHIESDE